MKRLLSDKYDKFDKALFLQLFYQRLPPAIQQNLFTVKTKLKIEELAELADEFIQSIPGDKISSSSTNSSINQVQPPQVTQLVELVSKLTLSLNSLQSQVSSLQAQVSNLSQMSRRSRSRSRQHSKGRSSSIHRNGMCYYHKTFGDKARKCDPPCSFHGSSLNTQGEH